jgi:hypothetical protein
MLIIVVPVVVTLVGVVCLMMCADTDRPLD